MLIIGVSWEVLVGVYTFGTFNVAKSFVLCARPFSLSRRRSRHCDAEDFFKHSPNFYIVERSVKISFSAAFFSEMIRQKSCSDVMSTPYLVVSLP